jgi:ABC-type transport system involved in multi-copper enzyme maturation permease subunit
MTNPVLLNDLRKSWFRRRPVHAVALMAILILVLTLSIAAGIPSMFGWSGTQVPLWRFPDLLLPVIAPAFAAGAFAKEHEQRTWQDVLLTRLTAGQIVGGKFFACFFPTMATIIVLLPPLAMILILTNVQWAQEPGPWMAAFSFRFLISAVFYLAVALVCSYHSSNARISLVIGYVVLALIGLVSYFFWGNVIDIISGSDSPAGTIYYTPYSERNDLLTLSRHEFGFSMPDLAFMSQSIVLSAVLFLYLLRRIRERRAPNL